MMLTSIWRTWLLISQRRRYLTDWNTAESATWDGTTERPSVQCWGHTGDPFYAAKTGRFLGEPWESHFFSYRVEKNTCVVRNWEMAEANKLHIFVLQLWALFQVSKHLRVSEKHIRSPGPSIWENGHSPMLSPAAWLIENNENKAN